MRQVCYALIPAVLVYIAWFGLGIVVHLVIALLTAWACEYLVARLRGFAVRDNIADGSAAVTAILIALAVPPYGSWWLTVWAVAFAIFIAKHAYGGLGHNVFNPAMAGYLFVLLCFPAATSDWIVLGGLVTQFNAWDGVQHIFGVTAASLNGISGATILDTVKTQTALMQMQSEISDIEAFGHIAGRGWEWLSASYLLGGIWLLARRIIRWRLPVSYLVGLSITAGCAYIIDPELHRGVLFHLFAGGAMMAAFFVVTDPRHLGGDTARNVDIRRQRRRIDLSDPRVRRLP